MARASVIFAILASLCLSSPKYAAAGPVTVDSVYREVYRNKNLSSYTRGFCGDNAITLLRLFAKKVPGFDVRRAHVLFFGDFHDRFAIELPAIWPTNYHGVVEYDGKIYDQDYGREPKPVRVEEYVAKAVPVLPDGTNSDLRIRRVPGADLLSDENLPLTHNPEGPPEIDLEYYFEFMPGKESPDAARKYPALTRETFLQAVAADSLAYPSRKTLRTCAWRGFKGFLGR